MISSNKGHNSVLEDKIKITISYSVSRTLQSAKTFKIIYSTEMQTMAFHFKSDFILDINPFHYYYLPWQSRGIKKRNPQFTA